MPKIHRDRPPTHLRADIAEAAAEAAPVVDRPSPSASKAAWVAYARAVGYEVGKRDTKASIIEGTA